MIKFLKKNYWKVLILLGVLLILGVGIVLFYKNYTDKEKVKEIKRYYNKYVEVAFNTNLYSKNKKKIGYIYKGFLLELDKTSIDKDTEYFKIKDSEYYIDYKSVKATKEFLKLEETNSNYLIFNLNVDNKKKTIFYLNNNKKLEIKDSVNTPILYMDNDYYYVNYWEKIFGVKKSESSTSKASNTDLGESESISVIDYSLASDKMLTDSLNYLKENGNYSITLNEYRLWLKGYIRLKDKAVLLISDNLKNSNNENFSIESVKDVSDLKFNKSNEVSKKDSKLDNINSYKIDSKTTIQTFKKMVNKEKIIEEKKVINSSSNEQKVAVLNYHFFYDENSEQCNENICLQTSRFREQLNYLRDNGYTTLSIDDFAKWMYGEIEVDEKSVLITVDDGAMGTSAINGNKLIPILEEYKMHATLFLITAWWNKDDYKSEYLDVESHGDDIHITGTCGKAKIHCLSEDELIKDFDTSISKLQTKTAFCYPFYAYNDTAISAIKKLGFKVAFMGGNRKAKRSDNKYLVPRYPIHKSTSMEQFISYVS